MGNLYDANGNLVTGGGDSQVQFVDELGQPYGIKHVQNKPRVSAIPYLYDIGEEAIPGHFSLGKFGRNNSVGLVEEDIWGQGGSYVYLTSAEVLKFSSTDANDAAAGTGARTVIVYGLDASYSEQNEIVTLNGLTPVATVNSYIRIYRICVVSAGANGSNIGVISATNNAGTNTLAIIEIGNNHTLMAIFPVPAGRTLFLTQFYASTISGKDTNILLYIRPFGEVFRVTRVMGIKDGIFSIQFPSTIRVEEKGDVTIRAFCEVAGGIVSAGFDGWYE